MFFSKWRGKVALLHLFVVLTLLLSLVPATIYAAPATETQAQGDKLSKSDQEELAKLEVNGVPTVKVLLAAKTGANQTLANQVQSLGGQIQYQENDIDYVRVELPVNKVKAAAALSSVEALELAKVIPLEDPKEPDAAGFVNPQTPPGANTPRNNPYMPIGDTGAAQFTAQYPKFDGREVTVGILDSGVDLAHPALQKTTTGKRKIIDWVTKTDPLTDGDPTWVNMSTVINLTNATTFTYNGVTYRIPREVADLNDKDLVYRLGIFDERDPNLGGELSNDVNRDGNPAGSKGTYAVLWRRVPSVDEDMVWVDTNQNNDFRDEKGMVDYKVKYDVSYFGTDNPATPIAERIPFVVQIDQKNKFVNIGIVSGAHGSHVAGIISANGMFGGAMSGAAPGTQIVSVRVCLFVAGCTNFALTEGMIYAAKTARVDVINMSIGGLPALNDGNNARAVLYNRLIDQYKVQMFFSAGNDGPGVNSIGDPAVVTKVMAVGTYITKASWQVNYGSDSSYVDNIHPFSSRGPSEDGEFKPQIIAPGSAISTIPTWEPGGPVGGTYALPPGYAMLQGTSMASPQATGAAALLLSAAKQKLDGDRVKPAVLRKVMNSTARFIDPAHYQAKDQGNGLINVPAAWDMLKNSSEEEIKTVDITSQVPVHTVLSGFLATPGVGMGIFDREGVQQGVSYTRTYTFTRTNGGNSNKTYNVNWVGNDGTFSSAGSVVLPLNTPVSFVVTVNPNVTGVHSAILNLDDPKNAGIEYQTMNVVIVPEVFKAANNYTVVKSGMAERNQTLSYFFNVPAGTPAFKVDLAGNFNSPGGGQVRFLRYHPYGVPIDSNQSTSCYTPSSGSCGGDALSRTVTNPTAGVWEVTVEARRTSDTASAPFTLTVAILGASVSPNPDIIPSATIGTPINRSYTLTNLLGAFTGRAVGTTLGSARRLVPTISTGQQQQYVVNVTAGSTSLRATIGSPSDPAADLDLYVFNCTSGSCVLAGQSADGDSEESVTIANPAAGPWVVLVDGYSTPSGSTTFNYVDVFTNAAFGSISLTDANALRSAGSSWTVPATITVGAAPAAGRVLLGNVQVRTDSNVLIGSGDVIIQSVTP